MLSLQVLWSTHRDPYGRRELLDTLDFPKLRPAPDYSLERAETGTNNHEAIAGAGAAVKFLAALAPAGDRRKMLHTVFSELHRRHAFLTTQMWEGLSSIPGVQVYGPPTGVPRTPTIGFTDDGFTSTHVAQLLAEMALFVSNGNFYVQTTVERLQVDGLVRAGCARYTTSDEVVRLLDGVREIAATYQSSPHR